MELQSYFQKIGSLRNELLALLPMAMEIQENLNKKFRLEFQYNSNHIEGNTLTYSETELLLIFDETRGSHSHREYEEMKGSDIAYELVEEFARDKERPLTENFIKNLNQIILVKPYGKDAVTTDGQPTRRKISVGDYKKYPNSVQLQNGEVFHYASPADTPKLMGELVDWFRTELPKEELHIAEFAALLHYKFVRIHPFDDGNGRISRLLLNYVLSYFNFPPVVIKSDDKINYLRALRDADTGNMPSFIKYIAEQIIWSLELSIKAAKNEPIEETEDWKKDLQLLKRELEGKDAIKFKKSDKILIKLVNKVILPFCSELERSLSEFDDLFLNKLFYYTPDIASQYFLFSKEVTDDTLKEHFQKNLRVFMMFKEFRKNLEHPFSVELRSVFEFDEYKYSFQICGEQIFSNLYHEPISEAQSKKAASISAKYILSQITEKKDMQI